MIHFTILQYLYEIWLQLKRIDKELSSLHDKYDKNLSRCLLVKVCLNFVSKILFHSQAFPVEIFTNKIEKPLFEL